jgi:hydroxymethylpyrimidine pyrophosphatase-like HAD family hydrolase
MRSSDDSTIIIDDIDIDKHKKKRKNIQEKTIRAIFSDYDGTLCSASAARDTSLGQNRIPLEIKEALQQISQQIPICIISSKDYFFLKETRAFARVMSCLMGIEMLSFASNYDAAIEQQQQSPIIQRKLSVEEESDLSAQSYALEEIARSIECDTELRNIIVERKYTSNRRILAGITVDWRDAQDWDYYRKLVHRFISTALRNLSQPPEPVASLYVQKYDFHPFVDVYIRECNKGTAFDLVLSELSAEAHDTLKENKNENRQNTITASSDSSSSSSSTIGGEDVLYLGDSENDNPAFRKAGVSVGIRSDSRIIPKLECQHIIKFDRLGSFLRQLKDDHFKFKEEQLIS